MDIIGILKSFFCSDCESQILSLQNTINQDNAKIADLTKQLSDLQLKYNTLLSQNTSGTIKIADLTGFKGKGNLVNPQLWFPGLLSEFADNSYYVYTLNDWKQILTMIHNSFTTSWQNEGFDCDEFAITTEALLSIFTDVAGFTDHNFALGMAWSSDHAYNILIDNTNTIWVYEPQTNSIVGKFTDAQNGLLNNGNLDYKSKEIWFMT